MRELACACLLAAAVSCEREPWPDGPPRSADEKRAARIWSERCVSCHRDDGRGGPAAATLSVKPRDLGDPEWQRGELDGELEAVIMLGGKALGYSDAMPANPDVSPEIAALLVKKVRSLKREE